MRPGLAPALVLAVVLVFLGSTLLFLLQPVPWLTVRALPQGELLHREPGQAGVPFAYHYVHSVEQVLVAEHYRIGPDGEIHLTGAETSALGAGLPYGAEGRFGVGDGTFIYDGLERPVAALRLKPTAFTACALVFEDARLDLDRPELAGRSVEVRVEMMPRMAAWRWIGAAAD